MKVHTDIIAGPFKYSPTGRIVLSRYVVDGSVAMMIEDPETGEPLLTASVNMPDARLAEDEICVKDWSENEGCEQALLNAGVIEPTGMSLGSHFVSANIFKIAGPLKPYLDQLPSATDFHNAMTEESEEWPF